MRFPSSRVSLWARGVTVRSHLTAVSSPRDSLGTDARGKFVVRRSRLPVVSDRPAAFGEGSKRAAVATSAESGVRSSARRERSARIPFQTADQSHFIPHSMALLVHDGESEVLLCRSCTACVDAPRDGTAHVRPVSSAGRPGLGGADSCFVRRRHSRFAVVAGAVHKSILCSAMAPL